MKMGDPKFDSISALERAKAKAESFLADIDLDLEVDMQESIITPDDDVKSKYPARTLIFTHKTNPNICWTMEIEETDEYINERFENAVRKIYQTTKESI